MILNALTDYYEQLLKEEKVGRDGWSFVKVSYAITIDASGQLRGIQPLMKPVQRGKKEVFVPVFRLAPLQKGRSRQIAPYFMCDNAKYLLGAWIASGNAEEDEKNQKQANDYFKASAAYHKEMLKNVDNTFSKSICRFFDTWNFEKCKDNFAVDWDKVLSAYNLVFRSFETTEELLSDAEICKVWDDNYQNGVQQKMGRCLVTGSIAPVARLHPLIKGVRGAQSSGAALVSFNGDAFESYGKEQGDNAPVSEYVAAAYGKALNYLLSNETHHRMLGDTTVVFWADAEEGEENYARFFTEFIGDIDETEEQKLLAVMDAITKGKSCVYEAGELRPETKFYVLGLAPNAARISIRFFYNSTFGNMISNIENHYERLAIEKTKYEKKEHPSISDVLYETVNKKATNKQAQPILVGALMRSILEDGRYPAGLYSHIMLRIHSERTINRNRAAVLKAYIIKNYPEKEEVVNSMKLNEDTEYMPYVLGRLFAEFEDIQRNAIKKETLRERYFNAASSTPAVIFPQLTKLSNSHMRVLGRENKGLQVKKDKELGALFDKIHANLPLRLSLEDQGIFMIGYYHQKQKFYEKKSNSESEIEDKQELTI